MCLCFQTAKCKNGAKKTEWPGQHTSGPLKGESTPNHVVTRHTHLLTRFSESASSPDLGHSPQMLSFCPTSTLHKHVYLFIYFLFIPHTIITSGYYLQSDAHTRAHTKPCLPKYISVIPFPCWPACFRGFASPSNQNQCYSRDVSWSVLRDTEKAWSI